MSAYRLILDFQQPSDLGARAVAAMVIGYMEEQTAVELPRIERVDEFGDSEVIDLAAVDHPKDIS